MIETDGQPDLEAAQDSLRPLREAPLYGLESQFMIHSLNVGPTGLENSIDAVIRLTAENPAIILLQDVKVTERRARFLKKAIARTCPGYKI